MTGHTRPRLGRRAMLGLLAAPALARTAHAQALIQNGETIADAELLAKARQEGVITMYGSLPTRNWSPSGEAFQRETGIRVDYINLISPRIYARANAEFAAGRLAADWLDSTEVLMAQDWMQRGMLRAPYKVPNFDSLDPVLRDPQGNWYSIFRTPYLITVNTGVVEPNEIPTSWADLLDPKWRSGRVGIPSIDGGGAFFNAYAFLREVIGEDYLRRLAAQRPRIYPSSTPLLTDLVRGEIGVTFMAPASIRNQLDQGAPLKAVLPQEGVSAYATTGGITTTAPHPNAARLYLNWLASRHGSNRVAASGIYGLHPQADTPAVPDIEIPPPNRVWTMPLDRWSERRDAYTANWRSIFGTR